MDILELESNLLLKSKEAVASIVDDSIKLSLSNRLKCAAENASQFRAEYFSFTNFTVYERDQLELSHAYLDLLTEYSHDSRKRNLLFEILLEEKILKDLREIRLAYMDGELRPKVCDHLLPLSTKNAFRKYLQKAKRKGIKKALIHGLTNRPSNHSKWTQITKDLVIYFAIDKPTHASSREIYNDLTYLVKEHPELQEKGIYLVKPSTIRKFIKEEGKADISYAKDNRNDFRRKILGTLKFFPPSANLVKVGADAYVFQVVCSDDETEKPIQLLAEIIYDLRSTAVLGLAFSHTENNNVFRKAFRDYFKTTGNILFREISMDKFSAHTCKKVKNLNKLFHDAGVDVTRSSNSNNNARLERLFRTFQDEILGRFLKCSYIGSGIKSRSDNALPARTVLITMRKKDFLKSEAEMIHLLTYFIKDYYNHQLKDELGNSPMDRFKKDQSNPLITLTQEEVAYCTYDAHPSTIIGCGVAIKHDKLVSLYKERSFKIATKHYDQSVQTFINPDDRTEPAFIFERDRRKFLFTMKYLSSIPCAMFDRSEADQEALRSFNKDTRELIAAIETELKAKEQRIEDFLGGLTINEISNAAIVKKEADTAYTSVQVGMKDKSLDPVFGRSNSLRKKKKIEKKTAEEKIVEKWNI